MNIQGLGYEFEAYYIEWALRVPDNIKNLKQYLQLILISRGCEKRKLIKSSYDFIDWK